MASDQTDGPDEQVQIDYDSKVQDALRKVVHDVLSETAENGLPGDHHFYITFKTQAEGVSVPARLVERYPDEMTIVLQHKYWGLSVDDKSFSVGLSFDRQIETLVIPLDTIIGFFDPSVKFALQFQDEDSLEDAEMLSDEPSDDLPESAGIHDGFFKAEHELVRQEEEQADSVDNADDAEKRSKGGESDNVVTLDAFRKK